MNTVATYQYETLQVSVTNTILTVTLNRPHKKNAMSFQVINELIAVLLAKKGFEWAGELGQKGDLP